jgi:hypothetical protein
MVVTASRIRIVACLAVLAAVLWPLRDPAWLATYSTGLRAWQERSDGTRYRWSGGHASFYVPADARQIRIPVATTFDDADSRAMIVTTTIDDNRASRILLTDSRWQIVELTMPPAGSRRFRRVDVRTNVTRADNHGVMIGSPVVGR